MRYSIIIPVKNEEKELPELLKQLTQQTIASEGEIIVADAFSTDTTREIASSFGARVVDGGLPGPGRNRGAEVAQGDWLLFMDADARPSAPDWLEKCLKQLEERKLDHATTKLLPMTDRWSERFFHEVYHLFVVMTSRMVPHAPGSCIFVKRSAFEHVQGFDERVVFAEDMELVQRLAHFGYRFGVLNHVPVQVSVRRLRKDGLWKTVKQYTYTELFMRIKGPVYQQKFDYSFDHTEKK